MEKEEAVKDRERSTVPEEVPDNVQREHVPVVAPPYVEFLAQTMNPPDNSRPPRRRREGEVSAELERLEDGYTNRIKLGLEKIQELAKQTQDTGEAQIRSLLADEEKHAGAEKQRLLQAKKDAGVEDLLETVTDRISNDAIFTPKGKMYMFEILSTNREWLQDYDNLCQARGRMRILCAFFGLIDRRSCGRRGRIARRHWERTGRAHIPGLLSS